MHLGAIQGDRAELQELDLPCDREHLHEQALQLGQKPAPKGAQRVMVRMGVGRNEAKGDRVVAGLLDLAARVGPGGIAVKH
jgi:hypothetical protein